MENRKKVLVVDDEQMVRWSLCRYLESEGYNAIEADSGPAALEIINANEIDIMITDLMMPTMSGVELIKKAQLQYPGLKILVITANETPEMIRSAIDAGASETFVKPIPFGKLVASLQRIM